jgi:hypothetical protein
MTVLVALLLLVGIVGVALGFVLFSVGRVIKEQVDALALACPMDANTRRAKIDGGMTAQEIAAEHGVEAERVIQQAMIGSRHRWVASLTRHTDWSRILH